MSEAPITATEPTPLEWEGTEIKRNKDIFDTIKSLSPDKAKEFTTALREKYGKTDADSLIFIGAFITTKTGRESASILSKMLGGDFSGEFYITEAPQDKYGNTAMDPSILKVKIVEHKVGSRRDISLDVLGPNEISSKWHSISPRAMRYFPVDGPERKLTRDEWTKLVDFKPSV